MSYDNGVLEIMGAVSQYGPDLEAYKSLGDIHVWRDGDLLLFHYTTRCMYQRRWNDVELSARSLVVNWRLLKVMALPWRKFFNLGERPETRLEALPAKRFEATEKVDGSLGVVFHDGERWRVVTKTQFRSTQGRWAENWLLHHINLSMLTPNLTYLTEIVFPENRIVIDYRGKEGLVLLGARVNETGFEFPWNWLRDLAAATGFEVVPAVQGCSLETFVQMAEAETGVEGWVLRYQDGLRVKIKTKDYLRLHRLITGLTPARVLDVYAGGGLESFLMGLPEEFADEARSMALVIGDFVEAEFTRVTRSMQAVRRAAGDGADRGTFARRVNEMVQPWDRPYMFALYDGKPLAPMIYRRIDSARLAELFPETEGSNFN
jgi:RNA ligase